MLKVIRNVKDGQYLITADEAVAYKSSLITDSSLSKVAQAIELQQAIDSAGIHPVALQVSGSKTIPLYDALSIKVDPKAITGENK